MPVSGHLPHTTREGTRLTTPSVGSLAANGTNVASSRRRRGATGEPIRCAGWLLPPPCSVGCHAVLRCGDHILALVTEYLERFVEDQTQLREDGAAANFRTWVVLDWLSDALSIVAQNGGTSDCGNRVPDRLLRYSAHDAGKNRLSARGNSALAARKNIGFDARTLRSREGKFPRVVSVLRSLHHESTSAFTSPFFRNAEI
jgi:hypothetical protein